MFHSFVSVKNYFWKKIFSGVHGLLWDPLWLAFTDHALPAIRYTWNNRFMLWASVSFLHGFFIWETVIIFSFLNDFKVYFYPHFCHLLSVISPIYILLAGLLATSFVVLNIIHSASRWFFISLFILNCHYTFLWKLVYLLRNS